MIERYKRKIISDIFTDQSKFEAFLEVEIKALEAWNILGLIPTEDLNKIKNKISFNLNDIYELEKQTKHDVIAFTRCLSKSLGDEKKWIHYGLTSTDVVDTANAILFKKANSIIFDDLNKLCDVLLSKALKYKNLACIGRTHGIHADITSFGLKFLLYYDEIKRNIKRFENARKEIECGKISGAVGNYCNLDPFIEKYVCEKLGINRANISTQVLQRDNHANLLAVFSLIASTLEKISLEIRHLQRTEVNEVLEYFDKNQKGSSAMPHKKNPIGCENICGCARVMKGYMISSFENIALWHERDISHSSVERIIFPDAYCLLDYMLNRLTNIVENLIVNEKNVEQNIYKTNKIIFAQRVMNALINKNWSREKAYDLIQKISIESYEYNIDFKELLLKDEAIKKQLSIDEIYNCFTLDYYFKNIDYIYDSVINNKK